MPCYKLHVPILWPRKRTLVTSCENTTEVDVKLEWCKSCISLATQYNCPGSMVCTDPRLKILSRQESLLGSTSRLKRMGSERFCTLMFWKSAPDATVETIVVGNQNAPLSPHFFSTRGAQYSTTIAPRRIVWMFRCSPDLHLTGSLRTFLR